MALGLPLAHIPSYFADHRHRRHDIDAIDLGRVRTDVPERAQVYPAHSRTISVRGNHHKMGAQG
jgi:hypothetical protein